MRPYEVMVIFDVGTEPPAIQAVIDRTTEVIRQGGGAPGRIDRWGRRPFAYEVNHQREGYYVLMEFATEPQAVAELDRHLTLSDGVVRHKVVRIPDKLAARKPATPPDATERDTAASRRPASRPPAGPPEQAGNGSTAASSAPAAPPAPLPHPGGAEAAGEPEQAADSEPGSTGAAPEEI